jgi:hypothetical protein
VAPQADLQPLVRQFARLVRAVAAKVGEPDGWAIDADAEQQVFDHLYRRLDGETSVDDQAAALYRHAVREIVCLLEPNPGPPTAGHIAAINWDHLAANELTGADRERLLQHAQSCRDCARVWHGVSTLKQEAEARKLIATTGRPWWRGPLVLLCVAVLIGLAVAAFFITLQTDS